MGRLFEDLMKDDELVPQFQRANTIVQYDYRNPGSKITVKMLEGEPTQVDLGATELEPEVVMSLEADTCHRFWLCEVTVTLPLARGQRHASDPVAQALKLVPLVRPAVPR